jgi:DNA-binding transcriptional MerR regulator
MQMRIAELARRSGIPVGTVKYYLREGLLPPGELTAATQAQYSDAHVQRLGLIRALLGPGGLSIAATREVLEVIDDPTTSLRHPRSWTKRATTSDDGAGRSTTPHPR